MSHTLIDIYNNVLKYNNCEIIVVIDDNNNPWFCAMDVAIILQYKNTRKAIIKNVDKEDKTTFNNLKKYMNNIPDNMQPHSVYINESGLYNLIWASKKPIAQKFKKWVSSEVLPSIRKTGSYHIEEKYQNKLDKLNNKLKDAKKQIRILKHNQKKNNYQATGLIYVLRQIDASNKKLLKPGKTKNFNKRLNTYNTSVPNNMEILFTLEVDDVDAVEHCIKGLMNKYIYRKNKEYYETTFKKLRGTIIKCDKLVHEDYHCDECQSRVTSIDHFYDEYDIEDDDSLFINLEVDQKGGSSEEILKEIPINNPFIFEKYCQVHLHPFVTHTKTYYECRIDKINNLLSKCHEFIDNQILDDLMNTCGPSEIVLIDIPSSEQKGGSRLSPEEFNEQIIVMDGGGFILPNGAVVYPNGKVVCPEENPQFNQIGGYVRDIALTNEINDQRERIFKSLDNIC